MLLDAYVDIIFFVQYKQLLGNIQDELLLQYCSTFSKK